MTTETKVMNGIVYENVGGSWVPIGEVAQNGHASSSNGSRFVSPAGLKPRPARWLWDGRLPVGVATLIAGIPGQGKSHVCLDIAAKVTRGELAGDFAGTPRAVVVMSSEDMLLETIVPRLIALGPI